jgi:hypothetical protein
MTRAKTILGVERMSLADRQAYQRHIENRRIEMSVTETAFEKGARQARIEMAQKLLKVNTELLFAAEMSGLSLEEVALLAAGKPLPELLDGGQED